MPTTSDLYWTFFIISNHGKYCVDIPFTQSYSMQCNDKHAWLSNSDAKMQPYFWSIDVVKVILGNIIKILASWHVTTKKEGTFFLKCKTQFSYEEVFYILYHLHFSRDNPIFHIIISIRISPYLKYILYQMNW